jgi:hypothetical protein
LDDLSVTGALALLRSMALDEGMEKEMKKMRVQLRTGATVCLAVLAMVLMASPAMADSGISE